MKKLLRLVALTALVGSSLFASAGPVAAASGGACTSDHTSAWAGIGSSAGSRNGVQAVIDLPDATTFTNCGDVSVPSATSAWIGMQGNDPNVLNHGQIMQIGVTECDNVVFNLPSYCNDDGGKPHFFFAKGGCTAPLFNVISDLGDADYNSHVYLVDRVNVTSGDWRFYIDGLLKVTVASTDPYIFCWDDISSRTANISGERWNRGDSWGPANGNQHTAFTNMWFRVGSTWVEQNAGSGCSVTPTTGVGTSHCLRTDGQDRMDIWSVY